MPLLGPATVWILLAASLALFLSSAKTHGRQLRLERLLAGYDHVEFGSRTNPTWVEALWRLDRIRFWTLTPLPGTVLVAVNLMVEAAAPESLAVGGALGHNLIAFLLWAPTLAFLANGALSWTRVRRRLAQDPRDAPESERRHAHAHTFVASAGLWTLDAALAVIVVILAHA